MAPTFVPSVHGFAFSNAWPSAPAVELPTPFGTISIGNASAGLCGGMVFAALDFWHAGVAPPRTRPAARSRLYRYLVRRLVDSWNLPAGVAQYYLWMCLPDADTGFDLLGRHVVTERGLGWRTIQNQWPQVRADLDAGTPVPLGIVTVASARPSDLSENHQVLAFGYTVSGSQVSVDVYDPNQPGRDDVAIWFDTRAPSGVTTFVHTLALSHPVRGFFRTAYAPSVLP